MGAGELRRKGDLLLGDDGYHIQAVLQSRFDGLGETQAVVLQPEIERGGNTVHHQVDGVLLAPFHDGVVGGERDAFHHVRVLGDARISGQCVELANGGALRQLPGEGVLTPAAAKDEAIKVLETEVAQATSRLRSLELERDELSREHAEKLELLKRTTEQSLAEVRFVPLVEGTAKEG